MQSIIIKAHTPSIPILPRPHFNSVKSLWFSKESFSRDEAFSSGFLRMHERYMRVHSFPTTSMDSAALFLAATAAPKSADISVLLPTSALMLFVYWIANFVLPDLIMKDTQTDRDGKDEGEYSTDDGRGSSQTKRMQNSAQGKKGFGSPKKS